MPTYFIVMLFCGLTCLAVFHPVSLVFKNSWRNGERKDYVYCFVIICAFLFMMGCTLMFGLLTCDAMAGGY